MNARPSPRVRLVVDLQAFTRDVEALKADLDAARGPDDLDHLRKIKRWARVATILGWGLAWFPNPVAPVALAFARSLRWTSIAHHILHRGYDQVPGALPHETSRGFAKGWRRWLDWPDWLEPEAWCREHNTLHHYRLGEEHDPDVVELNAAGLQDVPRWLRPIATVGLMFVWKWLYYAPSNTRELLDFQAGHRLPPERADRMDTAMLSPFDPRGRVVWRTSWLPYALRTFMVLPLLFLPFGPAAVLSVLATSVVAELLTNVHTFLIVVPNHAGADLLRFEGKPRGRGEFWIRQVVGSVDYRTGGDVNDALYGWLNYQIEHHVFPDMTMRQYRLAQPRLKAICEAHGVPYVQQPLWKRVWRVFRVMDGVDRSPVLDLVDAGAVGEPVAPAQSFEANSQNPGSSRAAASLA